jgi:hypothetical protein
MAHYAKLDENNIVLEVIVIDNLDCLDDNGNECEEKGRKYCEELTGHANWKKTSRNTYGGVHYDVETAQPSNDQSKAFRVNFGSVGMKYDPILDRFIKPRTSELDNNPLLEYNTELGIYETVSVPLPPEDLRLEEFPIETYFKKWIWNVLEKEWVKVRRDQEFPQKHYYPSYFWPEENSEP